MRRTRTLLLIGCAALAVMYLAAVTARIVYRKHYVWLPGYMSWWWNRPPAAPTVHLLVLFTDHWEPGAFYERADRWEAEYPRLADRHRDARGRPLQHTWFYPIEQPFRHDLEVLQRLVHRGYGEVEAHLHHHADTALSVARKIDLGIELLQSYGFSRTIAGETRFAFIHGNNHLDASGPYCGVTDELRVLAGKGCFADFTFPAVWDSSQPSHVNQLRFVIDDPAPKSYDRGEVVSVGSQRPVGGLVLFPGPLTVWYAGLSRLLLGVEDGNIHPSVPTTAARVDRWVNTAVHVAGRPEWVFVKLWGHGAGSDADAADILSGTYERALERFETRYNDGQRYILHYVTAREAYNVAMAAAAGRSGDPSQFYDFEIPPYEASLARPRGAHDAAVCGADPETAGCAAR